MLAHYFHHLAILNRGIFVCVAGALSRCTELKTITDKGNERGALSSLLMFLYPIFNWMGIKYPHQPMFGILQANMLMHCIIGVIDGPMTYFYDFLRPGTYLKVIPFGVTEAVGI